MLLPLSARDATKLNEGGKLIMLKKQLMLQERDIELLHFLAVYRRIKLEDTRNIYQTNIYYLRRIEKLSKYKYITRSMKLIHLGKAGKDYLDNNNIKIRKWCRNDVNINRIERISNIAGSFYNSKYEFIPSFNLKKDIYTKSGRKYMGQLVDKKANITYIVYYLPDNMNKQLLKTIQKDIQKEKQENNVLIFYDSGESAAKYGIQSYGFNELLLMQFTEDNIQLFKNYNPNKIKKFISNKMHTNLHPSLWQGADYFIEENSSYISLLLLQDIRKIQEILQYFKLNGNSKRQITIICSTKDKDRYEKLLPMCKIKIFNPKEDDDLWINQKL